MKKLVPFKKDIVFDTNIHEINSISLEYEITEKEGSLISGKFVINGDYHMTENSETLDTYEYELPFNINIDKKYNIDNSNIDISDFYYEVINNKILSVNIELEVDNIEEREMEEIMDRCVEEEEITENIDFEEQNEEIEEKVENTEIVKSIFDNLDNEESYTTYKIHIITENDTIESISMDYMVTKEQLENYNDLSDIKIGDKLIVPANEN